MFNVISIQFAIHYAFANIDSFRMICRNFNNFLANNGIIIGTTMNGKKVEELLGSK